MRTRTFASNAALTAGTNILLAFVGLLTGVLAARVLGVGGRGELAAVQLWPTIIATIAMMGLAEAIVYNVARDSRQLGEFVSTAVLLALLFGSVLGIVGYALLPYLLGNAPRQVLEVGREYLAIVPVLAIVGLPYHALRGRGDFVAWNAVRIAPGMVWLLLLLSAAILGTTSVRWLSLGYVGSLLLLGGFIGLFIWRRTKCSFVPRILHVRTLLSFGMRSLATTGPGLLTVRLDQMILIAFFTPTMLGLYVVALGWASAVMPMLSALASVTFPRVAATEDEHARNAIFAKAVRTAVVAAVGALVPVSLLAPIMVPLLFGQAFAPAIVPSMLLSVSMAIGGMSQVLEEGLRGLGRPASILIAQAIAVPLTMLGMWLLLPIWGLLGASAAAIVGALSMFIMLAIVARAITGLPLRQFCFPTMLDLTGFLQHLRVWVRGLMNRGKAQ